MKYNFSLLFTILFLAACSPKTTTAVEETPDVPEVPDPPKVVDKATTPCVTFADLSPSLKDDVETAYVLYKDFLKLDNYEKAIPMWKKAYYNAPGSNGRVKYQFDDGVKIYTHLFQNATTAADKKMYVDSVNAVYDKRVECFGDPAYIAGRKGFDYYYTFYEYAEKDQAFNLLKQNLMENKEKADYFVINPLTKLLHDKVVDGEVGVEQGRTMAKYILDAIEYGKANCKGTVCDAWAIVDDYAPNRLEALEGVDGFYDCAYYTEKYYPLYEANPSNCDTLNLVYRRMLRGGCQMSNPKLAALKQKKDTDCYVAPPEPGLLRQGYDAYNAGNYSDAVSKFDTYVQKQTDPAKKFKYGMLIAKIYYRDIKNFPQARKYALAAAESMPSNGEPYMLIGKLYASSGPLCGPGRGWDSQVVTWPAIDMFKKAKQVDPSMAAEANQWIGQYQQYMPKKEDIFQRRIKAGTTYKVGCWIQRNTTVRTAD